jgi:hypothetical protein
LELSQRIPPVQQICPNFKKKKKKRNSLLTVLFSAGPGAMVKQEKLLRCKILRRHPLLGTLCTGHDPEREYLLKFCSLDASLASF